MFRYLITWRLHHHSFLGEELDNTLILYAGALLIHNVQKLLLGLRAVDLELTTLHLALDLELTALHLALDLELTTLHQAFIWFQTALNLIIERLHRLYGMGGCNRPFMILHIINQNNIPSNSPLCWLICVLVCPWSPHSSTGFGPSTTPAFAGRVAYSYRSFVGIAIMMWWWYDTWSDWF